MEYPKSTCTSVDVYRICGITYMYMYRTAVHNWMWRPRMPQDFVPFHTCFYLANVTDEINSFRVSVELCLRLKFRARSDRQHELCNNLTFWWYSGLCFKITNLEKMSRFQKSMHNYPACKYVNLIRSIPFSTL